MNEGGDPFSQSFDWDYIPKRTWWTIDECKRDFLKTKEKYKHSTYQGYKILLRAFIRDQYLSGKLIKSITKQDFLDYLMRDGIKNVTRHTERRKLKTFWLWCMKEDRVSENIISDIELPAKKVDYKPKMISKEELNDVFQAYYDHQKWRKKQPWYRDHMAQEWFVPAMKTFFYTGFRRSEVGYDKNKDYSGIKGEDILHRNKKVIQFIYQSQSKGKKERFVPVANDLEKELLKYFKKRGWPDKNKYVFINGKGQPITSRNMLDVFKDYCEKADVSDARTIHGMRHRRATMWLEMGSTLKEVKEMLGHYSVEITDRLYTHLTPNMLKDKMEQLDNS